MRPTRGDHLELLGDYGLHKAGSLGTFKCIDPYQGADEDDIYIVQMDNGPEIGGYVYRWRVVDDSSDEIADFFV